MASSEMTFGLMPFSRQAWSTKAAHRSGMSSARSRSGGARSGTTARRKYRSSRNVPAATAACRSRFVAAMTRTSILSVCSPPTRVNSPDCKTRSTLACAAALVPEQLRLDELGRNGGAVDLDEGLVGERARLVHGARDELFPRARLARD